MKNIKIVYFTKFALVAALLTTAAHAENKEAKEARLKVMHTYAGALHMVQDGFLYNKKEKILKGGNIILDTAKEVLKHDMQSHLPENKAYTFKFAEKMTDRIIVHAESLIDATNRDNPLEAMDEFNYVIKQCTSCHLRVRSW